MTESNRNENTTEGTDAPEEANEAQIITSAIGYGIIFALFAIIVVFFYVQNQAPSIDAEDIALREQILSETTAAQIEATTTYAWIDKEKGVLRIPVERAMDIIVKELGEEGPPETDESGQQTAETGTTSAIEGTGH